MRRVMVTGGAGFIGSHVVDSFVSEGDDVLVIDDLSRGRRENVSSRASLVVLDIRDEMRTIFDDFKPSVVVHAAAQVSVPISMAEPATDASVNVVGTANVLEAAGASGTVGTFVNVSSVAVYGEPSEVPITEDAPLLPLSCYGASKRAAEDIVRIVGDARGMRWVSLRLANVYGPRQSSEGEGGVVAVFASRLVSGEPCVIHGTGTQTRDFVYVGDVAGACLAAAAGAPRGVFNIGTGTETSVRSLFEMMSEAMGGGTSEEGTARSGDIFQMVIDPHRARHELSWAASTSLAEGVKHTMDWVKNQNGDRS